MSIMNIYFDNEKDIHTNSEIKKKVATISIFKIC